MADMFVQIGGVDLWFKDINSLAQCVSGASISYYPAEISLLWNQIFITITIKA
jgi:hypothetical protein